MCVCLSECVRVCECVRACLRRVCVCVINLTVSVAVKHHQRRKEEVEEEDDGTLGVWR